MVIVAASETPVKPKEPKQPQQVKPEFTRAEVWL